MTHPPSSQLRLGVQLVTVAGDVLLLTCKKKELKKKRRDREMRGKNAVMNVRGGLERGMKG